MVNQWEIYALKETFVERQQPNKTINETVLRYTTRR